MNYPSEILDVVNEKLARRRSKNEVKYNKRLSYAFESFPEIEKVTNEIKMLQTQFLMDALNDKPNDDKKINELYKKRQELLKKNKLTNLFDKIHDCKICEDTGIVKGKNEYCQCRSNFAQAEMAKKAGFGGLELADFSQFNLDYYDDEIAKFGVTRRQIAEKIFNSCLNFKQGNLVFSGATGLGKTFTAECIANEFIKNNKTVCYMPATRMFLLLDDYKFGKQIEEADKNKIKMIHSADLLIIDDLGAEFRGPFSDAMLFDIINARLRDGFSTIISTNLSISDIKLSYSPRIYSRVVGNYECFEFFGDDIREKMRYN